ncbi:MAG TPA: tetratricopeptide repeat protein [Candidatus Nitrosotenuis sp.]|nr:tetratricopeptide repeat protein [Candidatus Nitrosotenuis sp.]
MNRLRSMVVIAMLLAGAGALYTGSAARALPEQGGSYTPAEYKMFQAAVNEQTPATRIKLLDEFVLRFPESTLLPYIYRSYYISYSQVQDYLKAMDNVDKLLAQGDKVDKMPGLEQARLEALELRARLFFLALNQRKITTPEQYSAARKASEEGIKFVGQRVKPENITDEQFKQQNDVLLSLFHSVAATSAFQAKDFKGAIESYKAALAITPNDGSLYYRLGLSYLNLDPPQSNDGFWAIARAISLKVPGEAQIRNFLRDRMLRFQLTTCEKLLDAQLNELLTLAAAGGERPQNFAIPSHEEIAKLQADSNIDNVLADLKAGGDKAKLRWLAFCGVEYPQLGGKVFEVADAEGAVLVKVFAAGEAEAIDAGTEPNLELRIEGQPAAAKLKKEDAILFAGRLEDYSPDPFLVRLTKVKVDPEYLPKEEEKPAKKAPTKRPTKRPPGR